MKEITLRPEAGLEYNHLAQPVGVALPAWKPAPFPGKEILTGRFCRLEPLAVERHAVELHAANQLDTDGRMWTYLPYGPFDSFESYSTWLQAAAQSTDPLYFAVVDLQTNRAVGVVSYLRIDPSNGVIEVGHLAYSPFMQRTPVATEAMYLMMRQAFELGYRRYEWKCDSLNAPSRQAAKRLGFRYEGLFRQAIVYKQRSRDTAWYSIIDREWPALKLAFEQWLSPTNFDTSGNQHSRLSDLTTAIAANPG